jgi:putative transcriptional regulator
MIMAGFEVSEPCTIRPRSFDIVARKSRIILAVKVVSHIDSITEEVARDLDQIADYIGGIPLIIGERSRETELERGAVYFRYGISSISVATLHDYFVEGLPPLVYASPGGLYVRISGEDLRELREHHKLSLGDMSQILGVSRRTISKYECGMGTTIDMAIRIEEVFDTSVMESIDLLSYTSQFKGERDRMEDPVTIPFLENMGMELHPLHKAPFQAVVTFDGYTILTGYGQANKMVKRAPLIGNISTVTRTHAMCVTTDDDRSRKIGRTLVIASERLRRMEDGSELIDLMSE